VIVIVVDGWREVNAVLPVARHLRVPVAVPCYDPDIEAGAGLRALALATGIPVGAFPDRIVNLTGRELRVKNQETGEFDSFPPEGRVIVDCDSHPVGAVQGVYPLITEDNCRVMVETPDGRRIPLDEFLRLLR